MGEAAVWAVVAVIAISSTLLAAVAAVAAIWLGETIRQAAQDLLAVLGQVPAGVSASPAVPAAGESPAGTAVPPGRQQAP